MRVRSQPEQHRNPGRERVCMRACGATPISGERPTRGINFRMDRKIR
jgi:hypothetical protein